MPLSDRPYPFDQLAHRLEGEVYSDLLHRHLLATDGSIFLKNPTAVVYPRTTGDVVQTLNFAARHSLTVHARGAGSGLTGAALGNGIILDFSRFMNRLLTIDTHAGWFECEPGYRLGELTAALQGSGWFFPPDPSSGQYATFGGMCATNASGAHSVKYGNIADYLLDAEVVTADGRVQRLSSISALPWDRLPTPWRDLADLYRQRRDAIETAYPPVRCNVAGYNLRGLVRNERLHLQRLICGSEGTLALTTRLRWRLLPRPAADSLLVAFFDDIAAAARAVQLTMPRAPAGIEVMDKSLLRLARDSDPLLRERIPGDVDNLLLIEFDGPGIAACTAAAADAQQRLIAAGLGRGHYLATDATEKQKFWAVRKAAVPILYKLKGRRKILALVEDAAVPLTALVPFFEGLYAIFRRLRVDFVLYGHIAKGLLHTRPLLDLKDPRDTALLRPIADAVFNLTTALNGTVAGEHGDGRLRSAYVRRRYPTIYTAFQTVKALFDPDGRLNPEIITYEDADQMTRDLRYSPGYRTTPPSTLKLRWPEGLADEAEKCHGCSKCTTITAETRMCPVYKFTRDEAATPKAKANALRALLSGAVPNRLQYAATYRQVMAYCIQCGSCFEECPSHVNIPKLALEAKAQYARRHPPPPAARLCAEVESVAQGLRPIIPLIRRATRLPALQRAGTRLLGWAPQRPLTGFARRSLFAGLPAYLPAQGGSSVLFFAGCYAAYIRPALGEAAVRLLQRLGLTVLIPEQHCCGLPLLAKGLADRARAKVQQNLDSWRRILARVDAIVVSCSSCGYALQHDWPALLDGPPIAAVRRRTQHISELLNHYGERLHYSAAPSRLAYHQPCHLRLQKAAGSSATLLRRLPGVDLTDLDNHCCGMAGGWGLSAANFALSRTIAQPLLQNLAASNATYAVTDCPTCQMQMEQLGPLPVRHPLEVVWQGLRSG